MSSIKAIFVNYFLLFFIFLTICSVNAQTNAPVRRPISPQQPMWLIHIDTWNWADPQKIIDMVPMDIRPYVVFNISLSINHDSNTGAFKTVEYGYETAKSWMRVCAENRVWAMIQPASGGFSHFSDFDLSASEEFYRDYPNFLGFNYCEQFWGFDDIFSVTWLQRVAHWVDLMKLNRKYGGYLLTSWCGNPWDASINPLAMMKRNPDFATICKESPQYFIFCEKYTQQSYQSDMESVSLGAYLSGFSGNYGIRYDETGWTDAAGASANFTMATGGAPYLEHMMLTGETVIDGPETVTGQCSRELSTGVTFDGYTTRRWEFFPQFYNVPMDIFRKVIDGTVRIPSRQEVIDRTKVVIVNNVNSGTDQDLYSSPQTLFEGLYRMDGDGNYESNKSFFKKTGRYPTIPTVYQLADIKANSFAVKVNKSSYATRWPSIASKVSEFDGLFPSEYTGDIYAGRHENSWVIYNPFKTGVLATGSIPFKYNTCDHVDLSLSQYTAGVIKEYSDKMNVYLSNYDNVNSALKTDIIKVYGSTAEPTYTYTDRANHQPSSVTKSWAGGVFTLIVNHNGPLDITINCAGTASGRLSSYTTATIITPEKPAAYTGLRQYEAEVFDYKNVARNYTNGVNSGFVNYTGQGFMEFGTNSSASIKKNINVLRKGNYILDTKYFVNMYDINTVDLYVNGVKVSTPTFVATGSWSSNKQNISLNAGSNTIEFRANNSGASSIYFDNIVLSQGNASGIYDFKSDVATSGASTPAAELVTVQSGTAGVFSYTDGNSKTSNCFKSYSTGSTNGTGVADLDMFPTQATNYSVIWKEYYGTTGGKKGVLLRGTGANGSCAYATGMKQGYLFIAQNNNDNTVTLKSFIANAAGVSEQPSYTTSFNVNANQPCWYRATAVGSTLKFECSKDSTTWLGGTNTTFTDNTFTAGSTELVWGLSSNNFSWLMDNITYLSGNVSTSNVSLTGFNYTQGSGPSASKTFNVSGNSLTDNIIINASTNYEVSTSSVSGYVSSLSLPQIAGKIVSTPIYVRLKSGLTAGNNYSGEITLNSNSIPTQSLVLSGAVAPQSITGMYDFTSDAATNAAGTPPALNTSVAQDNGATAGVVSYTDALSTTSNVLRPYSGGQRNSTGVINLGLFSGKGADYSVTWKQYVAGSKDYKVGVLLRGDASKIGDASTGYVQGMMQGYLFIAYTKASGGSEFRIYKSNSTYNALSMLINTGVTAFTPTAGQPIWYRASVSGSTNVSLKLEYSTDNVSWTIGATYSDSVSPFAYGSTQLVWGLGVGNVDFYLDNITFTGTEAITTDIKPNLVTKDGLTVISQEFYTLTGIRVYNYNNTLRGLYIVKNNMSDGSIISSKVLFTR